MAIRLPVHVELDDSLDSVKRDATRVFDSLGSDLGSLLSRGIGDGLTGVLHGATAELGGFGKAAESVFAKIPEGAGAAALGIGGIVVAAAAAGKALYDLGDTWDSIGDSITMATGRTGESLAALQDVVGDVGSMTAASLSDIGKVVEQLVQQFPNLDTAGESIRLMASDIATLNAAGQRVDIHELGLAMRVFGVSAEGGTKALDDFAAVARATGTPISQIISQVRSGAPLFKQFGLDMGESASYLAAFDAAGVQGSNTMAALRAALVKLSGDSRGAGEALQETITEIKRLSDAGDEYQARQLAIETFGKRAFAPMLETITSGALELDKLNKALDGTAMSIQEMKEATDDGKESWQELSNTMQVKFKPLADIVFSAVNDGAMALTGNLNEVQGGFKVTADRAGDLRDRLSEIVELQRQFQPDSPLGRMLLPAGVPGAPTQGGIGGPGGVGGTAGQGRDTGLGVNQGLGGFAGLPGGGGGGSGPGPQIPYPDEYTAGPIPGESAQQYQARMSQIEADHKVAQAQAQLDAVQADKNHTADQLQQALNQLAEARQNAQQTQLRNSQAGTSGGIDVAIPYAPGYGAVEPGETTQQYTARQAVLEAQHKAAEEQAKLRQMESSGVATQNDIINQKNKVLEALKAQQAAEMRLNDAYTKQVEDATKGMDALGAGLDRDLGLSKGLAGLADNLVRFLGSLAAAPLMGQLNAISQAQGGIGTTGSGLIAMAAAQGAFGPDYQVGGYDTSGKPYSVAAAGGGTTTQQQALSAMPAGYAKAVEIAEESSGKPYRYGGAGDALHQFLYDCSGFMSDIYSSLTGQQTGVRRFSTTSNFAALGFMPGYDRNSLFNIGVNPQPGMSGHMAGTLGGVNVESGGAANMTQYGGTAAGALSPQFSQQWHLPNGMIVNQPMTYDSGGPLMPGITIAQNNSGQPEHVLTNQQLSQVAKASNAPAGAPFNTTVNVGGAAVGGQPTVGQQGPTQIGGTEPKAQSGASAGAGGGLFGAGIGAAAAAADMWAPGSGAAVQIAGQEIQRAIKAGGQFAGIVAGGLMETFLPTGASQIANDNWVTRIGGAFAGMAPQLPNLAGKPPTPIPNKVDAQSPMPLFGDTGTPKQPGGGSPTFNLTLNSNGPIEDRHIDNLTNSLNRQYETGMAQVGGR